ncbi:MAG TPA: ATP-binding protein [Nitrospirota bacterium]
MGTGKGAGVFVKIADRFTARLVMYGILVLFAGLIAFSTELFLERRNFIPLKEAAVDALLTGLLFAVAAFLFELFLRRRSGQTDQLEAEIRKADTMLATVLQAIPDLVYIKDAEGRHLLVNRAVENFSGQTSKQLYGKSMADFLPADLAAPCIRSDREPIITGRPCRVEERFAIAGAVQIFDTIKAPLRNELGDIIGIVGVSRNITGKLKEGEERRLLQTELLKAQKMEALGHLAGGIAHDFNNILTAIIGFTSLLKAKHQDDDFLARQADQILAASQRGKALIKTLFAFSNKQKIDMMPLDLNVLIAESRKLLLQLINERIALKMTSCSGPLTVLADRLQLERVFMNLAANARDAMPNGGDLVFSTDTFAMQDDFIKKHGFGVPGNYALLTVSDSGKGMSDENMKKIFEPFFTTKETGKGTGLGLAIVYGIIKQHKGFITVSSVPDRGTIFHVFLPLVCSV